MIGGGSTQKTIGNAPGADSGSLSAVRWDDLSASLIASRLDTASGRLDYDFFNGGVSFQANARYPEEPVVIPIQAWHRMLIGEGAVCRPHFHWLQQQAEVPNMLLGYKLTNYGESTDFETDWSNYTFLPVNGSVFTYTSGTLAQITRFDEIDISSLTISGSIDFVLFRDSANVSGLFSGADPVASNITIKYNDSHVKIDSDGSRQEIVK